MITGEVSAYREAVITLPVYNADGEAVSLKTVLDTGFTEYLTLPSAVIAALGLVRSDTTRLLLANGLREWFRVYEAVVLWDEEERVIRIHEADGGPLLGMSMLAGYHLAMDVVDGGPIRLSRIR